MATSSKRSSKPQEEEARLPVAMQPPSVGGHTHHGGMDAAFVWQQLAEIQKTLGTIDAKLDHAQRATAKLETDILRS